jgi:hypothetical protein
LGGTYPTRTHVRIVERTRGGRQQAGLVTWPSGIMVRHGRDFTRVREWPWRKGAKMPRCRRFEEAV